MERMVRALMWLSSAAIVSGLLAMAMIVANHGQLYPAGWYTGDGAQQPAMLTMFFNYWPVGLDQTATYLMAGAALAGVALAWVERRWYWMAAGLALIAATIIFPDAMNILLASSFPTVHPRVGAFLATNATLVIFMLEVTPPTLTLAYLLRHHRASISVTRDEADAALEITRSAI